MGLTFRASLRHEMVPSQPFRRPDLGHAEGSKLSATAIFTGPQICGCEHGVSTVPLTARG
jgi:hypothetical protein